MCIVHFCICARACIECLRLTPNTLLQVEKEQNTRSNGYGPTVRPTVRVHVCLYVRMHALHVCLYGYVYVTVLEGG